MAKYRLKRRTKNFGFLGTVGKFVTKNPFSAVGGLAATAAIGTGIKKGADLVTGETINK